MRKTFCILSNAYFKMHFNPNLKCIIQTEFAYKMHKSFIPKPMNIWLCIDNKIFLCISRYENNGAYNMHIYAYFMHKMCHKFALGLCHMNFKKLCIMPMAQFFGRGFNKHVFTVYNNL